MFRSHSEIDKWSEMYLAKLCFAYSIIVINPAFGKNARNPPFAPSPVGNDDGTWIKVKPWIDPSSRMLSNADRGAVFRKITNTDKSTLQVSVANDNESNRRNERHISRRSEDNNPIPEVDVSHVTLYKEDDGYSVEVNWKRPTQKTNFTWIYGVFYGVNEEDMLSYPRDETTNTTVLVPSLEFCQKYIFTLAIIGPIGVGPFSKNYCFVNVPLDEKAPPEKLDVEYEPGEYPKVLIQWSASCPVVFRPIGYNVMIYDMKNSEIVITTLPPSTDAELQFKFNAMFGAIYEIKVSTNTNGANYTPAVAFQVPFYLQPYKAKVTRALNDTFIVYWREPHVPQTVGRYKYEVLVSTSNVLDETSAETHQVVKPIFVYNGNGSEYSFGVKLVTNMGYNSLVTNAEYVANDDQ